MLNDSSQFDKLIDYKKLIMFKPYLKRTKLTQIQLYTKTQSHPHSDHDKLQKSKYSLATSTFGIQQSIIFPTSFYEKQSSLGDNPLTTVFNPLNSQWIEFPQTIKRLIENSQFEREQLRNFGCYREVIWYYHENILYIWNHNDKIVNRYEMHKQTGCIQVGELQSSSLHFKTRNLYIIAAGVTNRLYLFGIDKKTLSISDLKFNYQIINSRLIQKIKFIKQNEIIIGSDTALLCHFDFSVDLKVSYNKLSIMQIALPYLPLLYPDSRSYIQNLVMTDDFIHLLIKQQKPINWFKLKTKETLNKLMMKDGEIPKYVQRRVIEVHQLDRSKTQINKICRVTQEQFIKKLKLKFPQFLEYKEQQDLKIVSIYEDKYKFGSLGVVTRCGYFINLTVSDSSIIVNELLKAPKENSVGIAGLYLQKKGNEEVQNRENVVRSSLGANNLSVINNCIWYFSPNSLECVKCEKIEGSQIFQIKNDDSQKSIWLVFSKLGYCKIKRLETSQVLIAYLCARSKLKEEEEKSWTYEANFQIFIENLAKLIGYQQICQSLISFLISDRKIVKIAQPIMELAETQLKGTPNRDLRDWDYSIGNQTPTIQIAISQFLKDQLWKCFIQMQSKAPNKQDQTLVSNQIHCSSYWYALRKNFVKQSSPLLKLQAKTMKLRLQKTQQRIKRLQKLQQFFSLKKENEFKYLTMKLNNKKDTIRRDKYSSNRYPSGKLKPVLLPIQPKKEEQITQSSVQPGSIISSLKFVNESSTKLQELISWSIKKLKSFVVVYIYLADLNENQKLGSLQEVLKNRKERNAMKKYLLERVQDQQKLIQFSKTLPQLQLQKALQFNKWYKHQQKNSYKPQNLNLVQISKIITSQNFKEIKEIFRQKYDLQADLFLLYWDYLYSQMDFLNKKQIIQSKKTEIFTKEVAAFKKEKTQSIYEQMNAIKLQIQQIITSSIKLYIDSRGDEYRKAETILNNIIKIITSHNDETIITYAQSEMSNAGLIQKQILLQRSKKKKEIIPTATEILTSTYELKPQPKVRRECLSNYQVYLLQDDK